MCQKHYSRHYLSNNIHCYMFSKEIKKLALKKSGNELTTKIKTQEKSAGN